MSKITKKIIISRIDELETVLDSWEFYKKNPIEIVEQLEAELEELYKMLE